MQKHVHNAYCWLCHHSVLQFRNQTPTAFYSLWTWIPSHANSKTKGTHNVEGVMEKDKVIDTENSSSQSSDMLSELLAWSAWLTSVGHPPFDILLQIFDFLSLRTLDPPILSSLLLPQLTSPESQPLPGFKVLGAVKIAMALPWLTSVSQAFPSSDTFLRIFSLTILKYHLRPQLKSVSSLTPHTLPESRRLLYSLGSSP